MFCSVKQERQTGSSVLRCLAICSAESVESGNPIGGSQPFRSSLCATVFCFSVIIASLARHKTPLLLKGYKTCLRFLSWVSGA